MPVACDARAMPLGVVVTGATANDGCQTAAVLPAVVVQPPAMLIPYEHYVKFVQADESGVLDRVDRALARMAELNADYSDEEIEADLIQATKAVRARKRKAS